MADHKTSYFGERHLGKRDGFEMSGGYSRLPDFEGIHPGRSSAAHLRPCGDDRSHKSTWQIPPHTPIPDLERSDSTAVTYISIGYRFRTGNPNPCFSRGFWMASKVCTIVHLPSSPALDSQVLLVKRRETTKFVVL